MTATEITPGLIDQIDADEPRPELADTLAVIFAPAQPGHRAADRLLSQAQTWLRQHHCPEAAASSVGWWRVAVATSGQLPLRNPLPEIDPVVAGWSR